MASAKGSSATQVMWWASLAHTLLALVLVSTRASAQREAMTREQILDLAKAGMGHGYKWGGSTWTLDGSRKGQCMLREGFPEGCPDCDYPSDKVGADCAGFVGKAWQLKKPTPVDQDFRPYSAGDFFSGSSEWKEISFNDLRPGDGLARSSHTVLFKELSGGAYQTYEAMGCKWNMTEGTHKIDASTGVESRPGKSDRQWRAIRRLDVKEAIACTEAPCGDRGECNEGICDCKDNYVTSPEAKMEFQCDRCAEGFINHPTCQEASTSCTVKSALACKSKFTVDPTADGSDQLSGYACGGGGSGKELAYRFAPPGSGKAKFKVDGGSARIMRGACAPEACVQTGDMELEYGGNEVFFVAIESDGNSGPISVEVDCDTGESVWIGDSCNDDSDCDMHRATGEAVSGFCYRTELGAGFCAKACTRGCPDLVNKAETFCAADPKKPEEGICVPKSDSRNSHCTQVPGVAQRRVNRFMDDSADALACMPVSAAESCEGDIAGSVVDALDQFGVDGGVIDIIDAEGNTVPSLNIDGDGAFKSGKLSCGEYTLLVVVDGYEPVEVTAKVTAGATTNLPRIKAVLEFACEDEGDILGTVFDGLTEERELVFGAQVSISEGVNNVSGPEIDSVETGVDGVFQFSELPPGNYTVTARLDGYSLGRANLVVCGGEEQRPAEISIVELEPGQMRIVLEWEVPADLDIHLQLPDGNEVFFWDPCRLNSAAGLDIDRMAAVGPETITVRSPGPGPYTLFVHNFSAQIDGAEGFAESSASVTVFGDDDQELARFDVPTGGDGFFWDVFSFDGANPQRLSPLQRLVNNRRNPYDEYTEECRP